ncbi:MAG: hypothetical protein ACKPE3_15510 [Sphaerospermopsis kisseleviana]
MRPRKRWTKQEIEFLKNNAEKCTLNQLVRLIGASRTSIYNKCQVLGLRVKRQPFREYSNKEIEFLRENAQKLSVQELAQALGRSESSIRLKASALDIRLKLSQGRWSTRSDSRIPKIRQRSRPQGEIADADADADIDYLTETFEDMWCGRCVNESASKTCSILSKAYKGRLPREWSAKNQICKNFQEN